MNNLDGLKKLRDPFPKHQISLLPKPTKKDAPKSECKICGGYHGQPAVHLEYVGHAALTDRLLDVDPSWHWEPLALTPDGLPQFDKSGGLWIKLTVCGVTRLGYGNAESSTFKEVGSREKEVIGDALRNAAMRFGAALDLWHKGDLHADKEEAKNEPIGLTRSLELKFKIKSQSATWTNEKIDEFIGEETGKKAYEITEQEAMRIYNYTIKNPSNKLKSGV